MHHRDDFSIVRMCNLQVSMKYFISFLSDKSQPSPPRGVGWATSNHSSSDYCNLLILTANEGTGHLERWKSLEYSRRQQRYRAEQKLLALCEIASVQAAAAALPPVTVVNDDDIKAK